ncbi:hypothetical protein RFI_24433 [Reticulomyxa filosa]|uniref:Uncharacterized protein n=1 Tax=Reticulomyxa filosa TaxID=46433 RepID=X6MHQ1_RETFI|nr:hypothetical protein RFI_24433 [Reticulomyxa filosa]|eukprot:ETO12942.1 hypothetical protein RFI_24433 [Reticulomyxa filosa]
MEKKKGGGGKEERGKREGNGNLEEIKNPLKREEQRLKESLNKGNKNILQPLTDRRHQSVEEGESCFKVSTLSHITTQMTQNKAEYGRPCIARAHLKFIAVGMENGAVFVFDHFEKLSVVLPVTETEGSDSVTAMTFSPNGQSLLVGHQKGSLVLWDIVNKKELKRVRDAHTSPIIYANFYKANQMKAITADSKYAKEEEKKKKKVVWTFSRIFFSYQADRQNIFSGQKTGVLYDIGIHRPNPNNRHVFDSFSLCAVANRNCVFFVSLDPTRILLPRIEHQPAEGCVPVLAWMDSSLPPRFVIFAFVTVSLFFSKGYEQM